jgi:single-strand DNA-binding protein
VLTVTAAGRLGKDAELRTAGRDQVCSFSIATSKKVKGEEKTQWIGASLWGKRGEALVQHLRKGTFVVITGELSIREHNGKSYLDCRVSELTFGGGAKPGAGAATKPPPGDDGTYDGADYGGSSGSTAGPEDDIPFVTATFGDEEPWTKC